MTVPPNSDRSQRISKWLSRREMLAHTAALAGGLFATGTARAADPAASPARGRNRPPTALRRPRIILNDDGTTFLYCCDDLGPEDLRVYLARLRNTHVDMVAYSVASGWFITYYESEVGQPIGSGLDLRAQTIGVKRMYRNRERLRRETGDYIGFVFKTLHELGIPALASVRMNDCHMTTDPNDCFAGRFWKSHLQWRLGPEFGYYGSSLDYAQPEVRAYLRRLLQEVIAKFPGIAGVELDGMRSPFFFKKGTGQTNAPLMTELVRQIRGDLDEAARIRGRQRYLLHVNVPRTPAFALDVGMDVAAWDAEKFVDGISPGCYNTDFQPANEQWRSLVGDRMWLHSYINCGAGTALYNSLEQYRAAAANAYGSGADGIYLFNFPCLDELSWMLPRPMERPPMPPPDFRAQCWHPDLTRSRQALGELGDPAALVHKDKHYLFYVPNPDYPHYTPEHAAIDRRKPQPAELAFRCYHAAGATTIRLQVKAVGVTVRDQFSLALNGQPIDAARIRRLHASGGRDARIHSIPLAPYSEYVVTLAPKMLRSGDNRLTVALSKADPELFEPIGLVELELFLQVLKSNDYTRSPKALPSSLPPHTLTGGSFRIIIGVS